MDREGKVRKEEVGLSSWPMSSSYPVTATNAHMEARKMLRMMTKKETKVVLKTETDAEEKEINNTEETKLSGIANVLASLCCDSQEQLEPEDVDEVDGLSEDILRPLVKLLFLKILLVDIGISVGDVVTDLLQGLNLVFDGDWNLQWSTYHYGLLVLGVMWIPGLVVLLHQATGKATHKLFPNGSNYVVNIGLGLVIFVCFPVIPTILYVRVLLTKRRFRSAQEKLVFLHLEAKSHEIKAITGATESPLELIILLWLITRGILQLPWDRTLASSCVEDSLGRVACLPSLPMASIVFSLLSILKTLNDLNLAPIMSKVNQAHSVLKLSYSCQLMAQFCPFFVCNIFFRMTAFAFIVTYLDYWAAIPGFMAFLLNLTHTSLLSASPDDEEQQIKENCLQDRADNHLRNRMEAIQNETRSSCSQDEEKVTPSNHMPILLNSVLGLFLPIGYCPPLPENPLSQKDPGLKAHVKSLSKRQARNLRSQAFLVNTCTITVVVAIYFLVQHTATFNYRSNILTPWWFTMACSYLLLLFTMSFILSWPIEPPCLRHEEPSIQVPSSNKRARSRHPTGESSRISVHSASSHLVTEDQGPTKLGLRLLLSLLLTLLVLVPSIVGIILFKTLPDHDYKLLQTHEGQDGLLHQHLTHLVSVNPEWEGVQMKSSHLTGCEDPQSFSNSVLLLNLTIPACRSLHRRLAPQAFGLNPPRAVVILDDNPRTLWRLSSPSRVVNLGHQLPVFMAHTLDWGSQEWRTEHVTVIKGQEDQMPIKPSCLPDGDVYVGKPFQQDCLRRKRLQEDGKLSETYCVRTTCSKNGISCFPPEMRYQDSICQTRLGSPFSVKTNNEKILEELKFMYNTTKENNICCNNSSNYLKYLGKDCNKIQLEHLKDPKCNFTDTFSLHPCSKTNQQENSKLCKIPGLNCVAVLSYTSNCGKTKPFHCDFEDLPCKSITGLKWN